MNANKDSLKRVLAQMGGVAKGLKAGQLRSKFGKMDEPDASGTPPLEGSPAEESSESPQEESLESDAAAAGAGAGGATDIVSELASADPEKVQALLSLLK